MIFFKFKEDKDSSKSRKRDFIEIEEEEFCASSKCIQPTGKIFFYQNS